MQTLRQRTDRRALDRDCAVGSEADGVAVVDSAVAGIGTAVVSAGVGGTVVGYVEGRGVDEFEGEGVDVVGHAAGEEGC